MSVESLKLPLYATDSALFGSFGNINNVSVSGKNIDVGALDDCSTLDDIVLKLDECGICSAFHKNIIARNVLLLRSTSFNVNVPAPPTDETCNDVQTMTIATQNRQSFSKEGMKLSSLQLFIDEIGGRSVLEGLPTIDIIDLYVKPLTIHTKSSYCAYLKTRDNNAVGEAHVFVCHTWKYKFLDLLDTLQSHFRDNTEVIIWLDLFSYNQHSDIGLDCESVIEQFNYIVFLTSPWNCSLPLIRSYCTKKCGCTFDVAMTQADQEEFQYAVKFDCKYAKCLGILSSDWRMNVIFKKESSNLEQLYSPINIFSTVYFDMKIYMKTLLDYVNCFSIYASECLKNSQQTITKNNLLVQTAPDIIDTETLHSIILGLGDGFELCAAIIRYNNITIDSIGDYTTENELMTKLNDLGIHNPFHQRVIARNILVWRSHTMERVMSAATLSTTSNTTHSSIESSRGTVYFPKEGIKLAALDIFINECGGRSMLEGLSTTDVNNLYQKPLTIHIKSSYCEYLKTRDSNSVGVAQVFISHAWKYVFLDVVDTLQYHFRDSPDIIIWFDVFSNNQHSAPDLDFHWWSTTFKSAIEQLNHTVLILSPWNNPIPLTRAWCLFEIYCTAECKCRFEVAMSLSDKTDFMESLRKDTVRTINDMLATIDLRKSDANKQEEKVRIFNAVERTVGFNGMNSLVFERLRMWIIDTAKEFVCKCSDDIDRAGAQQALGLLYMHQGQFEVAQPLLNESMAIREKVFGESHLDTLDAMNNMASYFQNTGIYDQALLLFKKCYAIKLNVLGVNHPSTLSSMNNLVILYQIMGKLEALIIQKKCLSIKVEVLGESHPSTLTSMNNLAVLYLKISRYNEALPLLTKCLALREESLGEDHPDTLTSMSNLAGLYQRTGRFDKAKYFGEKCLRIRDRVFGFKHHDTLGAMNNFASLYQNMGRYEEALSLYMKCLALKEEMLGETHPSTFSSMNDLALIYFKMGLYDEAVPISTKCLTMREKVLGETHPDTLESIYHLALLYYTMGKYDEAYFLFTKCMTLSKEKVGFQRHCSF